MEIIFITGNQNKLNEFNQILKNIKFTSQNIDLEEIQSTSIEEICEYKAKKAYEIIKKPLIVEDTGAYLDYLNGLPGPFIKFFLKNIGKHALIKLLANSKNRKCTIKTCITYYDGKQLINSIGTKEGTISHELSKGDGFGFDYCFIPEGFDKTYSEIGTELKNQISHRTNAIKQFEKDIKSILTQTN